MCLFSLKCSIVNDSGLELDLDMEVEDSSEEQPLEEQNTDKASSAKVRKSL